VWIDGSFSVVDGGGLATVARELLTEHDLVLAIHPESDDGWWGAGRKCLYDEAVFDYIAFRRDMEGLAADRAARLGSDTDLRVIQAIMDKMVLAHTKRDPANEALLDADFHLSIIEASHNVIMLHMMRSMYDLLREGVFYNRQIMFRQRSTRDTLLEQHSAINDAIQARDPVAARKAVEAHLDFVEQALTEQKKAERHEAIARQRYEHEQRR
jgi:GntR family transcriptional repressor for pyruvate dehydrogenase complex